MIVAKEARATMVGAALKENFEKRHSKISVAILGKKEEFANHFL